MASLTPRALLLCALLFLASTAFSQTYYPRCTHSETGTGDSFYKTSTIAPRPTTDIPVTMGNTESLHILVVFIRFNDDTEVGETI